MIAKADRGSHKGVLGWGVISCEEHVLWGDPFPAEKSSKKGHQRLTYVGAPSPDAGLSAPS